MSDHCEEIKLVVIGVDGSPASQYAVDFYFKYLHHACNEVLVLTCVEYPNTYAFGSYGAKAVGDIIDSYREAADELNHKYTKQLEEHKANGKFEARMCSDAGEEICLVAKERKAFTVVMGSRGLGWFKRLVMGSVSNYVLNHRDGAVCVVRPPHDLDGEKEEEEKKS